MKSRCASPATLLLACCWLAWTSGCGRHSPREAPGLHPAAVVQLRLVDDAAAPQPSYQRLERPAVFFDHAAHLEAVGNDCRRCHAADERGRFLPGLKELAGLAGREEQERAYHGLCIGCHRDRAANQGKAGPVLCGQCHGVPPPAGPAWSEIRFDLSLHQRHVAANGKKCATCHHLYDQQTNKLYYRKNTETACFDCHLDYDQGKNLSWKNAAHTDCIGCHLKKQKDYQQAQAAGQPADKKYGPLDCLGCHDAEKRRAIKKLEKIPRLDRGQLDHIWIKAEGGKANLVPFDHQRHEATSRFCTDCHHHALRSCQDCHDPAGKKRPGGGVSLEQAFHSPRSRFSCVGCHLAETSDKACAGCHALLPRRASEVSCRLCHRGPVPEKQAEQSLLVPPQARVKAAASTTVEHVAVPRDELFPEVPVPNLPLPNKITFPEKLVLDSGTKKYQPTKFPHLKIVRKLYQPVAKSPLAIFFQPRVEIFCAGCHHHQPLGQRPVACASCHPAQPPAHPDRPGLREAYHRQCLGCHRAMGLKQQGCTDCHKQEAKHKQEAGR